MKLRFFPTTIAILVLVLFSSTCLAIDTVRTVDPEMRVVFQEPVVITGHFLENLDISRSFETELVSSENDRIFIFKSTKALNNGLHRFTVYARDFVDNSGAYTYDFEVFVAGTEIVLIEPNKVGVANSTSFKVSISTSRPAVCKYTGIAVQSFDDIRLKMFDITGNLSGDTYTQIHTISSYTAEPGFPRHFYVSCVDDLGRENFAHFKLYADTSAPRLLTTIFSPSPVIEYPPEGDLYSTLMVTASEDVICRYADNPNVTYADMFLFEGYDRDDFDAYREHHEQMIDFPGDTIKDTFTYYVRCMDRARFRSSKKTVPVTVDLTEGLQIRMDSPPAFSNNKEVFLNLTTNRRAFCLYKAADTSTGDPISYSDPASALSSSFENLANNHHKDLGTKPAGTHSITIRCDVPEGVGLEAMSSEKVFTYTIDTTPPSRPKVNATTPVCGNTLSADFFANDTQSGISGYQWQVGSAGKVFTNGTTSEDSIFVSAYNNGTEFELSPDKTYSFVVKAVDGAGNIGGEGISNKIVYDATGVSCDNIPPSVIVTKSEDGQSVVIECIDDSSGCSLLGSYYTTTYQEPCNATQPFFDNPTIVPLFRTTIVCWEIKDNAGNVNSGSKIIEMNASDVGIEGAACTGGIDGDGDGYGERCLLGPDCDDTDPDKSVGCANGCVQDLDGDGYGIGCTAGNDCNGRNPNLTTSCPNNCISDNDGDEFGLGCDNGPDCKGDDSTLVMNCPNGCIDDNDGDGYGLGCPAGFDCHGEDYTKLKTCDNLCIQDTDGDEYGVGCIIGLDCHGRNPFTSLDCSNGCYFDEDGDGYGFGCRKGLDCNGMNPLIFTACPTGCVSDNDGDGYGWGCANGRECNDTDPYINLDCSQTTDCVYDHDGDGYGLGCDLGADCDDYDYILSGADCIGNCTYDEDCNALPDIWQNEFFNSSICTMPECGPQADPDDDGFTNIEEYRRDTNPLKKDVLDIPPEPSREDADADGDGMPDACERMYGLDASDPYDNSEDPDGDGLDNRFECTFRAGMCVNWLNPTSPDTDGDGYDDGVEYEAGTDPCNPDDHPSAGWFPLLLIILGILCIIGSTGYLIYRRYYVPLVSPPPKPAVVPRAVRAAARPAGVPPPGAKSMPRRLPPRRRPSGPTMSGELFAKELKKRKTERERILGVFGEKKNLSRPSKIMEKLARKHETKKAVRFVDRSMPAQSAPKSVLNHSQTQKPVDKQDYVNKLSGLIGKDHFDRLAGLSKEEADYFGKLASITKKKDVALEEDQVSKLANITQKVVEDKGKSKDLVAAFRKSDIDKLDEFLSSKQHVDTFIRTATPGKPKHEAAFDALTSMAKDPMQGMGALESFSSQKRTDIMGALSDLSSKADKESAISKMEHLSGIGSKDELFKAVKKMSKGKRLDKNVFEVILSYLLKSGKVTKHDVSELLFDLESEGVLVKKDVAEVFFNLGIKR